MCLHYNVRTGSRLSEHTWLNVTCDDNLMTKLPSRILHYQKVGYALGLTEADIKAIHESNNDEELKRMSVLQQWKRRNGSHATYFLLKEAFLSELVNDRETAEFIEDYAKDHYGMKLSICGPLMQVSSYPMADSRATTVSLVHTINELDQPHGVAVANDGRIIITENHNNSIKVIKEDGSILSSFFCWQMSSWCSCYTR